MKDFIHTVMHPELYHGAWLKPPFFEGWYFKMVSSDRKHAFAIIPGVFRKKEAAESHAFVQILDGNSGNVQVFEFPFSDFHIQDKQFDLAIKDNHFSRQGLTLTLADANCSVRAELRFGQGKAWPVRSLSPGVMGFFGWFNWMECYHGILSFDHALQGWLEFNGEKIDFTDGRGYIEKDFGKAFPQSWLWLQTNSFSEPGTSLSASVAIIPLGALRFKGVIVGLWHQSRLYAFTTYNLAKVLKFDLTEDHAFLHLRHGRYTLEVDAHKAEGGVLQAPVPGGMDRRITESLQSTARVTLKERGKLIFEDLGVRAGMEIVGDISQLSILE